MNTSKELKYGPIYGALALFTIYLLPLFLSTLISASDVKLFDAYIKSSHSSNTSHQ